MNVHPCANLSHGIHNNTSLYQDEDAAKLAWDRTLNFPKSAVQMASETDDAPGASYFRYEPKFVSPVVGCFPVRSLVGSGTACARTRFRNSSAVIFLAATSTTACAASIGSISKR